MRKARKAILIAILLLFSGGAGAPCLLAQTFTLTAKSSGAPTALVTTAIATQVTIKQTPEGGLVPFYVVDNTLGGDRVLVVTGATYTFTNPGGFPAGTTLGSIQPTATGTYTYTVIQSGSPTPVNPKTCPASQAVNAINEDGTVSCLVVATSAPVISVFGRIGAIVAATNDYDFTQLAGSLGHAQLPTLLSGDIPNNAANTSGTAAGLSGTPALPNGTTATTQSQADASTKLATTAYVDTGLSGKLATNGTAATATALAANPTNCSSGSYPLGIDASGNVENCTVAGTTKTVASGTAAMGTSAITSGTCATEVTAVATGALTSDSLIPDSNGTDLTGVTGYAPSAAGILTIFKRLATDLVGFKVCNNTPGSITPGALTLSWRVIR